MKFALRAALLPLLLAAAAPAVPAGSAAGPAPLPRSTVALGALDGEVIVRFKPGAALLRQHALAARATPAQVSDTLDRRARALGQRWGRTLAGGGALGERTQVLKGRGVDAATLARQLAADPDVEWAEPDLRMRALAAPNDPLYAAAAPGVRPQGVDAGQWYLRAPDATFRSAIDIEAAWARTQGLASVVIADVDTGVRPEHPDLAAKLLPGYDFIADSVSANDGDGRDADASDPGDWITQADLNADSSGRFSGCPVSGSSWHGTATSSVAAAATNNGVGMAGAAPGVRLLPVRVLGKCGTGRTSDIVAGMRWAAGISVPGVPDNPYPAKVINLSLGGSGSCSSAYQTAVNEILARGVVIVAAAGNSAGGPVGQPANCAGVIAVAGLRHAGSKVGFSDLGPEIAVAAPAGNCVNVTAGTACLYPILAATDSGTQGPVASRWTDSFNTTLGTSFSSPLVAGVAALMFSAQPALTPAQVLAALRATARPFPTTGADNGSDPTPVAQCGAPQSNVTQLQCYCTTALCGAGMLDAGAAVAAVTGMVQARIGVTTATPTAGSPVVLDGSGSSVGSGRQVAAWAWALVDGGGIATAFSSATNAASATLTPSAAGSFTVRLTVTDDLGATASATTTVTVAAAPSPPPAPAPAPAAGGSGGGAMSAPWLLALLAAVGWLGADRRRRTDADGP